MADIDLTGYYRLLALIFPPERRPTRQPKPARPTVPLVHNPTMDRELVRGRILVMLAKADQSQQ